MTYPWQRLHVKVSVMGFSWDFMTAQIMTHMPAINLIKHKLCAVTTHVL